VFSALSHDTIRPREISGKTVFPSGASPSGCAIFRSRNILASYGWQAIRSLVHCGRQIARSLQTTYNAESAELAEADKISAGFAVSAMIVAVSRPHIPATPGIGRTLALPHHLHWICFELVNAKRTRLHRAHDNFSAAIATPSSFEEAV
jgi:hypothetical protein